MTPSLPAAGPTAHLPTAPPDPPQTKREAARAFEKVLVRQFVQVMTKGMFKSTLSGQEGPSWMSSQRDNQRTLLTDVLTDHLSQSGTVDLEAMLLRDWGVNPASDPADDAAPRPAPPAPDAPRPALPLPPNSGSSKLALSLSRPRR